MVCDHELVSWAHDVTDTDGDVATIEHSEVQRDPPKCLS